METLSENEGGMLLQVLAGADFSVSSVSDAPLMDRDSPTADSESLEESAPTEGSTSCRLERGRCGSREASPSGELRLVPWRGTASRLGGRATGPPPPRGGRDGEPRRDPRLLDEGGDSSPRYSDLDILLFLDL